MELEVKESSTDLGIDFQLGALQQFKNCQCCSKSLFIVLCDNLKKYVTFRNTVSVSSENEMLRVVTKHHKTCHCHFHCCICHQYIDISNYEDIVKKRGKVKLDLRNSNVLLLTIHSTWHTSCKRPEMNIFSNYTQAGEEQFTLISTFLLNCIQKRMTGV